MRTQAEIRLLRLCEEVYQTSPQFICCSATIDNPKEHFEMRQGGVHVVTFPRHCVGEPGHDASLLARVERRRRGTILVGLAT